MFVIASVIALLSCHNSLRHDSTVTPFPAGYKEDHAPETFLENCTQLKESSAFRQNIAVCFNGDGHAAICMDLQHQLYLVVGSTLPARPDRFFENRYQKRISEETLAARMDRDSFVLKNRANSRTFGIYQIPSDADEAFAVELFNHLFNLNLKPNDLSFQWD